jgi:hypothetical protein
MLTRRPVVERTLAGGMMLGAAYWREVERLMCGLVQTQSRESGTELRVTRCGPTLLRLGNPQFSMTTDTISTTYPITGGLLARRAAGSITLSMHGGADLIELRSAIAGYYPTLASPPGAPAWTGELYNQIQARIHARVSRRYFQRLIDRAAP